MEKRELRIERDNELRRLHEYVIKDSGVNPKYLTRNDIVQALQAMSAPRFYIDWKMAQHYVNQYYCGIVKHKSAIKQRMVCDLVEAFEEIRPLHMNSPMFEVWQLVVEHPAKSFYLTNQRIIEIIFNYHDNGRKKDIGQ